MLPPSSATVAATTAATTAAATAASAGATAAPDGALQQRRLLKALIVVLVAGWLIAAATMAVSLARGEGWKEALRSTSLLQLHRLRLPGGMDSWGPMWSGLARLREGRAPAGSAAAAGAASAYTLALQLDRCKFQYPPSSWLLLEVLPEPAGLPLSCVDGGAPGADIHSATWSAKPWLAGASALACLGLVGLSMAMLWRTTGRPASATSAETAKAPQAPLWVAAALVGLGFYPLIKGHTLGQLQVFLNLALGAALLLWPRHAGASGLLVGLCSLFKPQYALFLAWGLLRGRWRFAAALAAVAAAGHGLALARYGLEVHVQYAQLLQGLAQVGESFWANQSVNGLLNRWLKTGDATVWAPATFPAGHPLVRWGTFFSSAGLLLAALWPPRARDAGGAVGGEAAVRLDFAAMLAALTLASPIAWEHHYGSLLPIFALLLGVLVTRPQWPARSGLVLGLAFVAMAHAVLRPEWIFTGPIAGLAGSHLWLGAMMLFALLLIWRARLARPGGTAMAAAAMVAGTVGSAARTVP